MTLQCFKEGGDKESKNKMKNHTQLLLSNSFTPHVGGWLASNTSKRVFLLPKLRYVPNQNWDAHWSLLLLFN